MLILNGSFRCSIWYQVSTIEIVSIWFIGIISYITRFSFDIHQLPAYCSSITITYRHHSITIIYRYRSIAIIYRYRIEVRSRSIYITHRCIRYTLFIGIVRYPSLVGIFSIDRYPPLIGIFDTHHFSVPFDIRHLSYRYCSMSIIYRYHSIFVTYRYRSISVIYRYRSISTTYRYRSICAYVFLPACGVLWCLLRVLCCIFVCKFIVHQALHVSMERYYVKHTFQSRYYFIAGLLSMSS